VVCIVDIDRIVDLLLLKHSFHNLVDYIYLNNVADLQQCSRFTTM